MLRVVRRPALELSRDPVGGYAWFPDPIDDPDVPSDAEIAREIVDALDGALPDDVRVYHDDGYRIVRVTGGPLS